MHCLRAIYRSVQFYRDTLGAEFIAEYEPPGLAFFRLGETRLLLEHSATTEPSGAVLYFEVPDIDDAYAALKARGVEFDSVPHLIHRDETGTFGPAGGEEWMAFFKDPHGNVLALASRIAAKAAEQVAAPHGRWYDPERPPVNPTVGPTENERIKR